MYSIWPSLSVLAFCLVIFLECRALAGRVTVPLRGFLAFFVYGCIGASLLSLLLQQIPFLQFTPVKNAHSDIVMPAAWLTGPPIEELAKALPIIVLAFVTRAWVRLSIADLTLAGFATGAGFGFVETMFQALVDGKLPSFQHLSVFGYQAIASATGDYVAYFGGHAVYPALFALAAGVGVRLLPLNRLYSWIPAAVVFAFVCFDHAMYNWKLLHPATAAGDAFLAAPMLVEILYLVTFHGRLDIWLLPIVLIVAEVVEAKLCLKAIGRRNDLLLPYEHRWWVINEWLVAILRLGYGRAAFVSALAYFRRRRAFALATFEAARNPADRALAQHIKLLEQRLMQERAILETPSYGQWLPHKSTFERKLRAWAWRMRWVLGFNTLFLVLVLLSVYRWPQWLWSLISTDVFTTIVVAMGLGFAAWRMHEFWHSPGLDPVAADGACYADRHARMLLVATSIMGGLSPLLSLVLGWKGLAPGAAYLSGVFAGWVGQGGNMYSAMGLGAMGVAIEAEAGPVGGALRDEIEADEARIEQLKRRIKRKFSFALAKPTHGALVVAEFMGLMAQLDAGRDMRGRHRRALDSCEREWAEMRADDLGAAVETVKAEFERLRAGFEGAAAEERRRLDAFELGFDKYLAQLAAELEAYDAVYLKVQSGFRDLWQPRKDLDWALRIAQSMDEKSVPLVAPFLPDLEGFAGNASGIEAELLNAAIVRIRASQAKFVPAQEIERHTDADDKEKQDVAVAPSAEEPAEPETPEHVRSLEDVDPPVGVAPESKATQEAESATTEVESDAPEAPQSSVIADELKKAAETEFDPGTASPDDFAEHESATGEPLESDTHTFDAVLDALFHTRELDLLDSDAIGKFELPVGRTSLDESLEAPEHRAVTPLGDFELPAHVGVVSPELQSLAEAIEDDEEPLPERPHSVNAPGWSPDAEGSAEPQSHHVAPVHQAQIHEWDSHGEHLHNVAAPFADFELPPHVGAVPPELQSRVEPVEDDEEPLPERPHSVNAPGWSPDAEGSAETQSYRGAPVHQAQIHEWDSHGEHLHDAPVPFAEFELPSHMGAVPPELQTLAEVVEDEEEPLAERPHSVNAPGWSPDAESFAESQSQPALRGVRFAELHEWIDTECEHRQTELKRLAAKADDAREALHAFMRELFDHAPVEAHTVAPSEEVSASEPPDLPPPSPPPPEAAVKKRDSGVDPASLPPVLDLPRLQADAEEDEPELPPMAVAESPKPEPVASPATATPVEIRRPTPEQTASADTPAPAQPHAPAAAPEAARPPAESTPSVEAFTPMAEATSTFGKKRVRVDDSLKLTPTTSKVTRAELDEAPVESKQTGASRGVGRGKFVRPAGEKPSTLQTETSNASIRPAKFYNSTSQGDAQNAQGQGASSASIRPAKFYKSGKSADPENFDRTPTAAATTAPAGGSQAQWPLAEALTEYFAQKGEEPPPMHTVDSATLKEVMESGRLDAARRGTSPWSFSGIPRRGDFAIRLKQGAERFVEFTPSTVTFGQTPRYYPRRVGVGTAQTYIPTEHLEYFDASARSWLPMKAAS